MPNKKKYFCPMLTWSVGLELMIWTQSPTLFTSEFPKEPTCVGGLPSSALRAVSWINLHTELSALELILNEVKR